MCGKLLAAAAVGRTSGNSEHQGIVLHALAVLGRIHRIDAETKDADAKLSSALLHSHRSQIRAAHRQLLVEPG